MRSKIPMLVAALTLLATGALTGNPTKPDRHDPVEPKIRQGRSPAFSSATATVDTVVLASYTFDSAGGAPDKQGWTIHDVSADEDVFFHVADATELDGGSFGRLNVLEGNQSLWCGADYDYNPELCSYVSLPGYGPWEQRFISRAFPRTGDVQVSFLYSLDTEPGYDFVSVGYIDKNGSKRFVKDYDGIASGFDSVTLPDSMMADTVQIFFELDGGNYTQTDKTGLWDTDGAWIMDSLSVTDGGGMIDFQDFESEAPGDLITADGDWRAERMGEFGSFGGLFDGTTVFQEDSLVFNGTNLWGFFNASPDTFDCTGGIVGGPPAWQPVIPDQRFDPGLGRDIYIRNEIWSPLIDLSLDEHGSPVPPGFETVLLEFDVYRDLPIDPLIFYNWHARGVFSGCGDEWDNDNLVWFSAQKDWYRQQIDITDYIAPGADDIQVALGVIDMCWTWCGPFGNGQCHTHAPLFDNVRIIKVNDTATGVGDLAPRRTALAQNYPNPFNPTTTITFTLDERQHVQLEVYDVTGTRVRTLVNATRAAGVLHSVEWNGRDDAGREVASGVYFYKLTAGDYTRTRKITLLK